MRHFTLVLLLIAACAPIVEVSPDLSSADAGTDESALPDAGAFTQTQVVFDYGQWTIPAGGEQYPCAQWTLNNEQPLYVNAVVQSNDGGFHHSNWYILGEDRFPGEDGFFDCEARGFEERQGAFFGDVIFAQSTQAYVETQELPAGVAIKVAPHSKIIGGIHLLNVSSAALPTNVRMGLELLHPRDVEVVATPWRMDNSALFIPGGDTHSRFVADCDMRNQYEYKTDEPFEVSLYWILPHYHATGDYFRVDLLKPQGDQTILELAGFNAEANGVTFDPPISTAGATGVRMVCGYTNPYDQMIYYGGRGTDEMCTLLAFTNAAMRMNSQVWEELGVDQSDGGFETHRGDCSPLFIPESPTQGMPTQEEIDAPLYVPESNTDGGVTLVPDCVDTPPDAEPSGAVTLSSLRDDVFGASCAYSACHDSDAPAGGLDFTADDLHSELYGHRLQTDAGMPLVTPGNAEQSWLYRVISSCRPETQTGTTSPMPRNSPRLLPAGEVARVRAWLAAGARDD